MADHSCAAAARCASAGCTEDDILFYCQGCRQTRCLDHADGHSGAATDRYAPGMRDHGALGFGLDDYGV